MAGLLNLNNIPNQQISGLNDDELKWVTHETNSRYVIELDSNLFNDLIEDFEQANKNEDGFKNLENDIIREMDEAEEDGIPNSTKFSTSQHVGKFKSFLASKGLSENIEKNAGFIFE